MRRTRGWAARGPASLHMVELERRDLRPEDIALRVDYCGVCHSDLHALHEYAQRTAGAESSEDPFVPGHECTGTVTEVGTEVTRFAVGDTVAVGVRCDMCTAGQENYCREFPTLTYGGVDRHDGTPTRGAFARELVVREEFAHHLPPGLDPAAAAPLLCAGITVWEPLRALAVSSGTRLAVVGLGGLGHLAVKLAVALGAEVTVLSRSAAKADDARRLGAHHLLVSTDEVAMTRARGSFDVVLDTVAVAHDLAPLLELLTLDGTLSQVGYLGPISLETLSLLMGRRKLTSAGSGGMAGTAQMLEFCAAHGVGADIELLPSSRIDDAFARLARGDVRYRVVLDLSDLEPDTAGFTASSPPPGQ